MILAISIVTIWVLLGVWGWWILCGKETLEDFKKKYYLLVTVSLFLFTLCSITGPIGLLAAWLTRDELG